jgi:hypothetical protein
MRLTSSEKACSTSRPRPSGSIILTGQRIRPPEFCDISPEASEVITIGHDSHRISPAIGSRKNRMPTMSTTFCPRGDSRLVRMSMRTCSLRRKV